MMNHHFLRSAISWFTLLAVVGGARSFMSGPGTSSMQRLANSVDYPFRMISSGFSFDDGEKILVSAQKPLGMVLEQDSNSGVISVAEVDASGSAGKRGVQVGDVLVAVQNTSMEKVDLDIVLEFIGNGPRVLNLRLVRGLSPASSGAPQ